MKNKTRSRLLTIALAIAMTVALMPAAALAEGDETVDVETYGDFAEAIGNATVTTINVTGNFTLTENVTIEREVAITSNAGKTITTGDYSIIITGSAAVVTISSDLTVTGKVPIQVINSGTADISGGTITTTSDNGYGIHVQSYSTVTVSGGTIKATGFNSKGIYVDVYSTVTISGGTIEATGTNSYGVYVFRYSSGTVSGGTIRGTSTDSYGIYVDNYSTAIISDEADINGYASGVRVYDNGRADIRGGTIAGAGDFSTGVWVTHNGTAVISGGTITAAGAYSHGVAVGYGGTVNVSGETEISCDECGVYVEDSAATISGDAAISGGITSVYVKGSSGTVTVSGGTITATSTDSYGLHVTNGSTATISGDAEISGVRYGVFVDESAADISGGTITTTGANSSGIAVEDGTVKIGGEAEISGEEYGVRVCEGENIINVSVSAGLTISGGVYNYDGKAFLTDLPGPVAMTAGETNTVELEGVDETINFVVERDTDSELVASIAGSIVTLAPPDTTPADTYNLVLYASSETNFFNLTIPVTVEHTVNIIAIAGVTAPVRDAAPVTAITDTAQYTGNVSWSPAVAHNKFAADTVYTATITLTAKPGFTLTGVTENIFTVAGATTVSNAAGSGVIIAVFPVTASASGSGGGDSGGSGGGDNSSGPSSPYPSVNTNPSKAVITSGTIDKETGTTPDGKTVETFTVHNTAASQIEQAKGEGKASVEFNIASSQASVIEITIPSTVLESASGMNIFISTPYATLELPAALVNALAVAGQDLNITMTRGGDVDDPQGGTVLGSTTEINSDIMGETQVTIPLTGVTIPANPQERVAFLNSLAVFTYHSDGEAELITGEIIYDANGNPVSISFPVHKFSTFAIVKLSQRTVALTIGSPMANLNSLAVTLDAPAFVDPQSNRTLVPLRFIGEALGAKVEWLSATRQVRIKDGDKEVFLTIDSQLALLNGQSTRIDCAPVIAPLGRTFLPLRFIAEALGAEVAYDDATKGITITRKYGK